MKSFMNKLSKAREASSIAFLMLVYLLVGIINVSFLSPNNIMLNLNGSVMYIFLAVGMAFVIFTKEVDVSIGSTLGMSAAIAGTMLRNNNNIFVIVIAALAVGAITGLINGFGVTKLKIPSIVMTLGTMGILRGLMFIYTGGKWVENLPDFFKKASQSSIFGINIYLIITIIIVIAIFIYMNKAKKGRYFHAVGDNIDGATLIGIPVTRFKILSFVISGVFASIAGLIYTSQVGFVSNVAGNGLEMTAIASCVLGGVSLNGGIGSVGGAAIGAVIMNTINTALVFLKVPAYWNNTISGLLLIVIVVADAVIHNRMSEKARKQRLSAKSMAGGEANE